MVVTLYCNKEQKIATSVWYWLLNPFIPKLDKYILPTENV